MITIKIILAVVYLSILIGLLEGNFKGDKNV